MIWKTEMGYLKLGLFLENLEWYSPCSLMTQRCARIMEVTKT